jgi:hypoxanthine phosphoribosyltransferase
VTAGIEEATGTPRPDPGTAVEAAENRGSTVAATRFAHASEAEMARILDFYAVRWEYEPTTFPILWNTDGDVIESFAPDFYLPELELFLEMTTLKQRLVRKKNRKLRRLRELYPDIRIKLFYARDFRAMMLKYGRYALFESLAGTSGQVVPDRAARPAPPIDATIDTMSTAATVAAAVPSEEATIDTAMPGATSRSRSARRRRRRATAIEIGAEREPGA